MHVILAGVCNIYTHYIATFEEYQVNKPAAWLRLNDVTELRQKKNVFAKIIWEKFRINEPKG